MDGIKLRYRPFYIDKNGGIYTNSILAFNEDGTINIEYTRCLDKDKKTDGVIMKRWVISGYIINPKDGRRVTIQYTAKAETIDDAIQQAREYGLMDIFDVSISSGG